MLLSAIASSLSFLYNKAKAILTYQEALARSSGSLTAMRESTAQTETSNEIFNHWIKRAEADLHMLVTKTSSGDYPYAGVPWYSTPFGRDGKITALQCLWFYPELARGVLTFLAENQATEEIPAQDAEPGKILHETRHGEMAAMGEVPFQLQMPATLCSAALLTLIMPGYWQRL